MPLFRTKQGRYRQGRIGGFASSGRRHRPISRPRLDQAPFGFLGDLHFFRVALEAKMYALVDLSYWTDASKPAKLRAELLSAISLTKRSRLSQSLSAAALMVVDMTRSSGLTRVAVAAASRTAAAISTVLERVRLLSAATISSSAIAMIKSFERAIAAVDVMAAALVTRFGATYQQVMSAANIAVASLARAQTRLLAMAGAAVLTTAIGIVGTIGRRLLAATNLTASAMTLSVRYLRSIAATTIGAPSVGKLMSLFRTLAAEAVLAPGVVARSINVIRQALSANAVFVANNLRQAWISAVGAFLGAVPTLSMSSIFRATLGGIKSMPGLFYRLGSVPAEQQINLIRVSMGAALQTTAQTFRQAWMFFFTTPMVTLPVFRNLPPLLGALRSVPRLLMGRLGSTPASVPARKVLGWFQVVLRRLGAGQKLFPFSPVLDTFDRANEDPILNYSQFGIATTSLKISGNLLATLSSTLVGMATRDASSFGDDQEAYLTLTTVDTNSGKSCGVVLRSADTHNGYLVRLRNTTPNWDVVIESVTADVTDSLFTATVATPANGDVFGARMINRTLYAFLNGARVGEFTVEAANALRGGKIGVYMAGALWRGDNFGGGTYTP